MRKNSKKTGLGIEYIIIFISVVILALVVSIILIKRMTPGKERMSGFDYWEIDENTDKVMVLLDGEKYADEGVWKNNQLYLSQKFIEKNINVRFYYDKDTDSIKYSNRSNIYTYMAEAEGYNDLEGNSYPTDYPVFVKINDVPMISWDYVAKFTDCDYQFEENPDRVLITLDRNVYQCVDVKEAGQVRYRAGIKSDILEDVDKGDTLKFIKKLDKDWVQVTTDAGFTGYIKSDIVSEEYEFKPESTFVEERVLPDNETKITLGWFQTFDVSTSTSIMAYHDRDSGVNVISPTWFSISSSDGDYTGLTTGVLPNYAHANGIEVWGLIDDFNKDVDYKEFFSSSKNRAYLIDCLMEDVLMQSLDAINLDFENIKEDYVCDYLQFIRELSIELHKHNRLLTIDNYVPMSHNAFYNIEEQSYFADYIIIMAYDEHYNGSEAGSVSSKSFVEKAINDTLEMVPKEQLIVGIPFYTRIWTVKDGVTTGKAVSMQAALDYLAERNITPVWDETVGQYTASFTEDGANILIWLEEETSIEEKMKIISEADVAGVAAWKMGLERDEVWSVIAKYNK
ncbi:MAG: glycosyl hydrolase family 18 protein [Lachnospira sp.]